MPFPKRVRAVLTGAGSGLGRALAIELGRREARLLLADVAPERLEAAAEAARAAGAAEVITQPADVARIEAVEALAATAEARFGGAELLVNNAGVAVAGRVGEVPLDDWRWQLDVNLWGVIHGCHVFAPRFAAQGSGWILNVASAAGLLSMPEMGPYNVTKSAVVALSRTTRVELGRSGVTVSVLCPSFFRSGLHETARTSSTELSGATARLVTQARWSADDVARVALRGLERGKLHVLPQLDARLFWALHRLWPAGFQRLVEWLYARDTLQRLARGDEAAPASAVRSRASEPGGGR